MSAADNDPVEELLKLREEFMASLIKRTEGPAELVASPDVWIERKEAAVQELYAALRILKAEREATVARYDQHLGQLESRVEALEAELGDERDTIDRAVGEARKPGGKPARPKRPARADKGRSNREPPDDA
jgi:hypothetical protein